MSQQPAPVSQMSSEFKKHLEPARLERYAFLWSETRLLIAALALFLGGVPPVIFIFGKIGLSSMVWSLLNLAWIISGIASLYLLYRWNEAGRRVFGGTDMRDTVAFFVSIVSGFNLGVTGLFGRNIGMSITHNYTIFIIVGVLYLVSAWHLHTRWKAFGEKLF